MDTERELLQGQRETCAAPYPLDEQIESPSDLWTNLASSYELACVERAATMKIKREVQRRVA
jgi:plasmid maintenance system antidote protein VapI